MNLEYLKKLKIKHIIIMLFFMFFTFACSNENSQFKEWIETMIISLNRGQLLFLIIVGSAFGSQFSR